MKFIDLTQPVYSGMPVYPGDPEVDVKVVQTLEKDGWLMRTIHMPTHVGTHVNVPAHAVKKGKTLDDYDMDRFCGSAVVYGKDEDISRKLGVIFRDQNIDLRLCGLIMARKPKFVGLAAEYEFDIELERKLLEADIISFENLVHTKQLPPKFMFYGFPLRIREGDGSPVRAVAMVE